MKAFEAIVRVGFAGPITLAVLALAILGALGLLAASLGIKRDTGGPILRWFAGVEGALFAASLGLVYGLVTAGRRVMLGIERPPRLEVGFGARGYALEQTECALLIGGLSLLLIGLLLGLSTAVWLFRTREARGRPFVLRSIVLLASSLLAATTALALFRHAALKLSQSRCAGGVEPPIMCWDAWIAEAHAPFEQARVLVLTIAAATTLILVAVAVGPRPLGESGLGRIPHVAAALVLAAGLGEYAITRALAHDAAHPIPAQASLGSPWSMGPEFDARALPEVSSCVGGALPYPGFYPFLVVAGADAWINRVHVDLDQADALLRKLHDEHRRRPLVIIAAAAGAPLMDVAPYLRVVRASFGPEILIALSVPRGIRPTRTLGDLPLCPRCCQRMVHLGAGPPATSYTTWGELAAAAAALPGDESLGVTP